MQLQGASVSDLRSDIQGHLCNYCGCMSMKPISTNGREVSYRCNRSFCEALVTHLITCQWHLLKGPCTCPKV